MRKHLKPIIFTTLACVFLLGAGVSAQAASKSPDVAINDTNFSSYLKWHAKNADTNGDGYLSGKEASNVKEIHFDSSDYVDSIKGIENFTNLENFDYDEMFFDESEGIYQKATASVIDLSNFKKLKRVQIYTITDYLRTINLQDCTNLREVYITGGCDSCIDALNLKGCTNLRAIELSGLNITKLNLAGFQHLKEISISDSTRSLQTLNLKKCSSLKTVSVWSDSLTKLKLKKAKNLDSLSVTGRDLISVDLSTNVQLKTLHLGWEIGRTGITSTDLSKNKKLETLRCHWTELVSLDLSNNPNLTKVDCHKNPNLTKVNVKGCRKLKTLRLENTNLAKLNVKTNTNLQVLRCKNTNLEKLNLKRNVNLRKLLCENTRLTELNLSNTRIRESSALECDPDVTVTYAK